MDFDSVWIVLPDGTRKLLGAEAKQGEYNIVRL